MKLLNQAAVYRHSVAHKGGDVFYGYVYKENIDLKKENRLECC